VGVEDGTALGWMEGKELGKAVGSTLGTKLGASVSTQTAMMLKSKIPASDPKAIVATPLPYHDEGTTSRILFSVELSLVTVARILVEPRTPSRSDSATPREK